MTKNVDYNKIRHYFLFAAIMIAITPILSLYTGKTGQILIATDKLDDARFSKTVIYITHHSLKGAHGIVLNKKMKDATNLYKLKNIDIYNGGPLKHDDAKYIIINRPKSSSQWQSQPITVKEINPLKSSNKEIDSVYIGFAGWGPFQLEQEIKQGLWRALPYNANIIDSPLSSEELWRSLAEK